MNKAILVPVLVVVVLAGAGGAYAGMKYQAGKTPARPTGAGAFTRTGTGGGRGGVGFNGTFGQVIAKSPTSLTVQLMDGSSRIVFVSAATPVAKQAAGSLTDVSVGTNIAVTGTSNSDGSVTASQIQIHPAGSPRPSPSATPAY